MSDDDSRGPALLSRCMLTFTPPWRSELATWKAIVHTSGKIWHEVHAGQGASQPETYRGRLSEADLRRFADLLDWDLAAEAARLEASAPVVDGGGFTGFGLARDDGQAWTTFGASDKLLCRFCGDTLEAEEIRRTFEEFKSMWLGLARLLPWQISVAETPR